MAISGTVLVVALALGSALGLAGCGGASEPVEVTAADATEPGAAEAQAPLDVTEELRAAGAGSSWVDSLTVARQTEPGRMEVATTIVDPRGEAGSTQALTAIEACQTGVAMLEASGAATAYVSVLEADGTTFVAYGHPAYPNGCSEV